MKPVIALVGRPNVGKSTLFNKLTRSRDALVADMPGVTRDRKYGTAEVDGHGFIVIDTGGLSGEKDEVDELMAQQTLQAIEEADVLVMLVDGREGLTAGDENVAQKIRRFNKKVILAVNKTDGVDPAMATAEFYPLGLGEAQPIAAVHGRGIKRLVEHVAEQFPQFTPEAQAEAEEEIPEGIKIALVGRPNVGKSTLVNRLLGEERMMAMDMPGTTRDSIFIPFERDGRHYTLIDTAGVRRRGRIREAIEKFSVVKTLQAIEAANVVIMVVDARENLSDQDLSLLSYVIDAGRALVIAINKWDGMTPEQREDVRHRIDLKLGFVDYAELHFISALHGSGVGLLMEAAENAYAAAMRKMGTTALTEELEAAVMQHQPPMVSGRRIKLRYAHQGGSNPPVIVIHGKQTERLPGAYKRYLENRFRKAFNLMGTPIRLELKTDENPYRGRRQKLTDTERRKALVKRKKTIKKWGK